MNPRWCYSVSSFPSKLLCEIDFMRISSPELSDMNFVDSHFLGSLNITVDSLFYLGHFPYFFNQPVGC